MERAGGVFTLIEAVTAPDPAARSRHDFPFKQARKDVALQPTPNKSAIFRFLHITFFISKIEEKFLLEQI